MNLKSENIPMVSIGQALLAEYGQGSSHTKIYRNIVGGAVPAVRETAGWVIKRSDLPALAKILRINTQDHAQ